MTPAGFSHSEIRGSRPMCGSPRLIAAYRVLRRLPEPRHPPCALAIFFSDGTRTYFRRSRRARRRCAQMRSSNRRKSTLSRYAALKVRRGRSPRDRTLRARRRGEDGRAGGRRLARQSKCFLSREAILPRKEVIQPHLPVRLPCYDFTPLTNHTFGDSPPFGLGRRLRVQSTRVV